MRWEGHVGHMREMRHVHKNLTGKPEGKIKLARPRFGRENNI
jgi:hypothetical protein